MDLTWSAAAEILAGETEEHGHAAAALVASAWNARMDVDATKTLMAVAVALTDIAVVNLFWSKDVDPCDGLDAYQLSAEEIAAEVTVTAKRATRLAAECFRVLQRAQAEHASAVTETRAAAQLPPDPGVQARLLVLNETRNQMSVVIADCEAAMETIDSAGQALNTALRMLGRTDTGLEDAYEPVLEFIADGGVLPKDGDFITEDTATRTAGG